MIPITIVVPVRNEEAILPRCLARLKAFEEVVVVDSQSSDRTVALAKDAGATIIQFAWNGLFPKKRNWVLQNHSFRTAWVLFLDADEEITPEFESEVATAIEKTQFSGYWIRYDNFFLGRRLRFGVPQRKLALFRIGKGEYERIDEERWSDLDMEIHEHPIIRGEVGEIRAPILHHDFKTVHGFVKRHNDYSDWEARRFLALRKEKGKDLTARQRFKYALLSSGPFPFVYFLFTYVLRGGFLDGAAGLHYALLKFAYFHQINLKIRELEMSPEKS